MAPLGKSPFRVASAATVIFAQSIALGSNLPTKKAAVGGENGGPVLVPFEQSSFSTHVITIKHGLQDPPEHHDARKSTRSSLVQ